VKGERFLEDFAEGQSFGLGPHLVTRKEIVAFAEEFDPQPFHLDEEAGIASVLGGHCASGWHSASIVMRLMCDAFLSRSAVLGSSGMEETKWLRPVRVSDELRGACIITGMRASASKPGIGIVNFKATLGGQDGLERISITGMVFMRRRGA
jgi:acyl dehydratase